MLINQLHEVVTDSLNRDLYTNAIFYGERLMSEQDSEEVRYLLGKSYIGEGKFHKAFNILKDTRSSRCRYLFAQICLKMNKLVEGERALLTDKHFSKNILSKEVESVIPNGSAGYYLLGMITEKIGSRTNDTINAYRKALDLDPLMWCAYEKLCKLCPSKLDPNKIFSDLNPKILIFKKNLLNGTNTNNINPLQINNQNLQLPSSHPPKDFSLSPDNVNNLNNKFNSIENKCVNTSYREKQVNRFNLISNNEDSVWREGNSNNLNACNLNMNNFNSNTSGYSMNAMNSMNPSNNQNMTPVVNKDKIEEYPSLNYNQLPVKNRDNLKPFLFSSSPQGMQLEFGVNPINTSSNNNYINSSNDLRQKYGDSVIKPFNITQGSGLVYNNEFLVTPNNIRNILNSNKSNEDNLSTNKLTNNIFNNIHLNENKNIGNLNIQQGHHKDLNIQNQNQKFNDITGLLKIFGEISKAFHLYNCEDAINLIKSLPFMHQKSSWILVTLGRCYFEVAKYKECDKVYRECIRLDPSRLEGMEYYSSCLWHLKDQYQLVNLASHVLEQSHFCAETWIVVGNCYSLQKEHELALKFFNRAIQINPNFSYAYTLCGHEYVENESFTQAKQCYSHAISCDDRHFNAWWGLGQIHLKEQNYSEAVRYFKKAHQINEKSAILNFYLASAYQQNKESSKALIYLKNAEKLDNNNPMIKYQKANILFNNKRDDEALQILLELNEKRPKEAPIHILIGRIYKTKKEFTKALNHFNAAIDIDPKDSNLAKSLIEKLYTESDEQ